MVEFPNKNLLKKDLDDVYHTLDRLPTVKTEGGDACKLLADRFRILRKLGEGGMGMVYLATDDMLEGAQVAIKFIPPTLASNPRAIKSLKQEAQTTRQLTHPYIVRLYDMHTDGFQYFIVMEYIPGRTLEQILAKKTRGKLGLSDTIYLGRQIAIGLDYAHSCHVLHRDLKPSNVMVYGDRYQIKILDFGIARELKDTYTRVTGKEQATGTLPYMSPEQLLGEQPTSLMDIYSFGALMYECLAGHPPFYRGDLREQIKNKQPDPIDGYNEEINGALRYALAKKPLERPGSARELVDLLLEAYKRMQSTPEPPAQEADNKKAPVEEPKPLMSETSSDSWDTHDSDDFTPVAKPSHKVLRTIGTFILGIMLAGLFFNRAELTRSYQEWRADGLYRQGREDYYRDAYDQAKASLNFILEQCPNYTKRPQVISLLNVIEENIHADSVFKDISNNLENITTDGGKVDRLEIVINNVYEFLGKYPNYKYLNCVIATLSDSMFKKSAALWKQELDNLPKNDISESDTLKSFIRICDDVKEVHAAKYTKEIPEPLLGKHIQYIKDLDFRRACCEAGLKALEADEAITNAGYERARACLDDDREGAKVRLRQAIQLLDGMDTAVIESIPRLARYEGEPLQELIAQTEQRLNHEQRMSDFNQRIGEVEGQIKDQKDLDGLNQLIGNYQQFVGQFSQDGAYYVDKINQLKESLIRQIHPLLGETDPQKRIKAAHLMLKLDGSHADALRVKRGIWEDNGLRSIIEIGDMELVEIARSTGTGSADEREWFFISRFEVTRRQWELLMGIMPRDGVAWLSGDNLSAYNRYPVVNMTFFEAREFCHRLEKQIGYGCECGLPSLRQWQYAYQCNQAPGIVVQGDCWSNQKDLVGPKPVDPSELRYANTWGLFHMMGNVAEWVESDSPGSSDLNGSAASVMAIQAGGSYADDRGKMINILKNEVSAGSKYPYTGFRVMMRVPFTALYDLVRETTNF